MRWDYAPLDISPVFPGLGEIIIIIIIIIIIFVLFLSFYFWLKNSFSNMKRLRIVDCFLFVCLFVCFVSWALFVG